MHWVGYRSWCVSHMPSGNKSCLPSEVLLDVEYYMAPIFLEANHWWFLSGLCLLGRYSVSAFPRNVHLTLSSPCPRPSAKSQFPSLCQLLEPLWQFLAHVCRICGLFANIAWPLQQCGFAYAVPYVPTNWMLAHWQFCLPLHTLQFAASTDVEYQFCV